MQNGLRSRVVLEADGKLMDGTDVAVACLLGAEEFGFATMPLIAMGCLMQRDCQQDTCPAGIATQNCRLRHGFAGKPEHVERFMLFVAEQLREVMARLGFATVDEMVGHVECLRQVEVEGNDKANLIDLSAVLAPAVCSFGRHLPGADACHYLPEMAADSQLERTLDATLFIPHTAEAREHLRPVRFHADIANINRCVGTMLGHAVTSAHPDGLPAGSITIDCDGSAGQSFGAFLPAGITLNVEGDANDYFGKGLSGGELSVRPKATASYSSTRTSLWATSLSLAPPAAAPTSTASPASASPCATPAPSRWSRAWQLRLRVHDRRMRADTGRGRPQLRRGMTGGIAYVYDEYGTLSSRINDGGIALRTPTQAELGQIRTPARGARSRNAEPARHQAALSLRRHQRPLCQGNPHRLRARHAAAVLDASYQKEA